MLPWQAWQRRGAGWLAELNGVQEVAPSNRAAPTRARRSSSWLARARVSLLAVCAVKIVFCRDDGLLTTYVVGQHLLNRRAAALQGGGRGGARPGGSGGE